MRSCLEFGAAHGERSQTCVAAGFSFRREVTAVQKVFPAPIVCKSGDDYISGTKGDRSATSSVQIAVRNHCPTRCRWLTTVWGVLPLLVVAAGFGECDAPL